MNLTEKHLANQKPIRTLVGLMLVAAFAAHASDDGTKALTSRQINQEALSCQLPSNCVNSFSSYGLEALAFEGNGEQAMALLRTTLATFPEATIVSSAPLYLEVIFTTAIGFKDQIEFRIDEPSKRIEFRSRSKFGLYDFNKNRSRMQDCSANFKTVTVDVKKAAEN
jgi:uncharacterized protein (DUF1499 family)